MRSRTGSVSRGRRRDGELQSKPIVVLVVHLLICRLGAATEYSDVNPATFNYDDEWQGNLTLQLVGWRGGLVVGRRTCDLVVAGSRPGRDAAA